MKFDLHGTKPRNVFGKDIFLHLDDPYERLYYTGLLYERRAKAMLKAGQPPRSLLALFDQMIAPEPEDRPGLVEVEKTLTRLNRQVLL